MQHNFDFIRGQAVGNVEFVAPNEIKVLLRTDAPQSTSINTGDPQFFPKVNGFVLFPNEIGATIGMIFWIGIEYSPYPKRRGYKDFDLVDLPFPSRKLSVRPLGVLKEEGEEFRVERGVFSYPSVGDVVLIPNQRQLRAIVENKEEGAMVKIGTVPNAANAPVYVAPDKIFGRHLAVLGNTGSGKSCSVAGLIRWSLETAKESLLDRKVLNSRFIIFDPNGEYSDAFNRLCNVRQFEVVLKDYKNEWNTDKNSINNTKNVSLKVPSWMWSSDEWCTIGLATDRTQKPILKQALREVKAGNVEDDNDLKVMKMWIKPLLEMLKDHEDTGFDRNNFRIKNNFAGMLDDTATDLMYLSGHASISDENKQAFKNISEYITKKVKKTKCKKYYEQVELEDISKLIKETERLLEAYDIEEIYDYEKPNEDCPVFFDNTELLSCLESISRKEGIQTHTDTFIMRIKSIMSNPRIASVIETKSRKEVTLEGWLNDYIGSNNEGGSITILDLSLLPSEVLYVITSVLSRLVFEAHQRYKKERGEILPTVLVVEEAHNFIRRYDYDDISGSGLCSQTFEKIAKEGRKFGVGLVISSQRPSELSPTVLSQCNTFLLHRIVNDRDQDMVKRLVPDNLEGMLDELPVLPTRKVALVGWAAPIPLIIEMNELPESHRPKSKDPDFWDVWIGKEERKVSWADICERWQNE